MRIVQLLPTLAYGDAIGNDVIELDKLLKNLGYDTKIYTQNIGKDIDASLVDKSEVLFQQIQADDIVIYHLSTGSILNDKIKQLHCKVIIDYHNITPPVFFEIYNQEAAERSIKGIDGVQGLKDYAKYCLADSEYNKQELQSIGYECDIDVLPIVLTFDKYNQKSDKKIIDRYKDDFVNIIFTGRIAPNKKQEDIIKTFYFYKKYINPKSRLFLVGSYNSMEKYKNALDNYVEKLELEDVIFTGHIKFNELLAYYKISDVFLCMSEHEGFCVPLLEAMYFRIPIIAYASTGVKDTLGECGMQMVTKDCRVAAEMINLLVDRVDLRKQIISEQLERLEDFSYEKTKAKFTKYLEKMMNI